MRSRINRFRAGLSPTARVVVAIFAFAIFAQIILAFISSGSDARRSREVALVNLDETLQNLHGQSDSAALGEPDASIRDALTEFDETVSELRMSIRSEGDEGLIRDCLQYRADIVRVAEAYQRGDIAAGRMLDVQTADPLHKALGARIDTATAAARRNARIWLLTVQVLGACTIYGQATFICILFLRTRRQLVKSSVEEASRAALEAGARRLRALIQNSSDVIMLATIDGSIAFVSSAAERAWGFPSIELIDSCYEALVVPSDRSRLAGCVKECLNNPRVEGQVEVQLTDSKGILHSCQVRVNNLLSDQDVRSLLLTFHDITERRQFEAELTHQAFHDGLTGLPNRVLMMDRLSQALRRTAASAQSLAVLFIDLDNFKLVNDSLGHEAGDQLLIQVAERIQSVVRPGDTVARLAGDEFTLFLEAADIEEEAVLVARRLIAKLQRPFTIAGKELFVTASVGVSISSEGCDAESLVRDADTAMYQVKGHGKSGYLLFDSTMQTCVAERLELQAGLCGALEREEFVLYFQPIVDLASQEVIDVEVLLRWNHPTLGLVPPIKFIPLLEETGLICQVGEWVLDEACAQLHRWERDFPETTMRISVNVSGRQLMQDHYVDQVADSLKRHHVNPKHLDLEVTESVMLVDLDACRKIFEALRELGVHISIDDFGTGYSSMSYLTHLPVDTLKIDKSFINLVASDSQSAGVVQAIIAMAKTLGLQVTSEGIESPDQVETLKKLGCDLGQGFYFARPMTNDAFSELLMARSMVQLMKAA